MKRKWMALALALGLAAGMAGCGNQSAPSSRQASSGPVSETMKPYNLHQVVAENNEKAEPLCGNCLRERIIPWNTGKGDPYGLHRSCLRQTAGRKQGYQKRYRIYGKAGSSGKGRIL